MKKFHSFFIAFILATCIGMAQSGSICWYEPVTGGQNDELTFYFDATQGNQGLKDYSGDVYVHAGIITKESTDDSDWKHAPDWGDNNAKYHLQRTEGNSNLYYFSMIPNEFYNLDGSEEIVYFAFVFRSGDCSKEGKGTGNTDILVKLITSGSDVDFGSGNSAGAYKSHSYENGVLTVNCSRSDLYVTPYNEYVFKVLSVPSGQTPDERRSISVIATPQASAVLDDRDDELVLSTSGMQVHINKTNGIISFCDLSSKVILSEKAGMDNSGGTKTCTFAAAGDYAFYGGGYNGQRINLDNTTITINNTQTGGWSSNVSAPHNICIPFVASSSGYGLLFDDLYRYSTITPSSVNGTSWSSKSQNHVAYYFIGGNGSMDDVMANYTFLTGRQELPPFWALGYMTSRYGYHSQAEADDVVNKFKSLDFPIDGIVFDLYWQGAGESGMGNLNWYSVNFADPQGMMESFLDKGVHTICITEPFFTSNSSNYAELSRLGYFADDNVSNMGWLNSPSVGLIDASNPDAMAWMWNFYRARTAEGVSGWWLDLGEPEQHDGDSNHKGGSVDQVHNEFGNLWVESVYNGWKNDFPDQRLFLMPRSGTAGMQRFSTFPWSGDIARIWEGLQAQVPALLSSGMSGVGYMGSDVGGFTSLYGPNADLYLRWVEFAVFSPMMRTHSADNPEPYLSYYQNIFDNVKNYVNLRYRYLPYTYTLSYENTVYGRPLARPIAYYGGSIRAQYNAYDLYLWGKDLLVAPVMTSSDSRSITFPDGEWVDMNDYSKTYSGGSTVNYTASLEKLPYFGRKGSFIAKYLQESFENTSEIDNSAWSVLYLRDENGGDASSFVYDDDKVSTVSLQNEDYILMNFTGTTKGVNETIAMSHEGYGYVGMPDLRTIVFEIPGMSPDFYYIDKVSESGSVTVEPVGSREEFEAAIDDKYYYDENGILWIKTRYDNKSDMGQTVNIIYDTRTSIGEMENDAMSFACLNQPVVSEAEFVYYLDTDYVSASIDVYDIRGTVCASIGNLSAAGGQNKAVLAASSLSSGIYIANLVVKGENATVQSKCKLIVR